jgi:murein DD-endopeptidase MepM/ murein hydrolase activator NlpD
MLRPIFATNMAKKSKKQKRLQRWRNKFRFVILNDDTFEEVITVKLSPLNIFTVSVFTILFTIALTTIVIAYTPLKEMIPGYASSKLRRESINLALKADSLEKSVLLNKQYITGIQRIMNGEIIDSVLIDIQEENDSLEAVVLSNPSEQDSAFRKWVEEENEFTLNQNAPELDIPQLMAPVDGLVTSVFESGIGHYAVDIASPKNTPVKSCYEGTVVYADWSSETGHVIIVQHESNLLSAYKHNSALLKSVGDFVRSGEAIAIIGNSGENSTGPHLHFELWYDGYAINPEEYIKF